MRFAYVLYRTGITANQIDVAGIGVSFVAFCGLATAAEGYTVVPVLGLLGLCFHVFLDFSDGPVARAAGASSNVGVYLDNLGGDLDRLLMFVTLGLYTGNTQLLIANTPAATVFIVLPPPTARELNDSPLAKLLLRVYTGRYSLLGCRFMLAALPLVLVLVTLFSRRLAEVASTISALYLAGACLWLLVCVLMTRPMPGR